MTNYEQGRQDYIDGIEYRYLSGSEEFEEWFQGYIDEQYKYVAD